MNWNFNDYDQYGFNRLELEEILGIDLSINLENDNNEIAASGSTNNDIEKLKLELEELKKKIAILESERPILLGEYRSDDPLLLAIQIRNKEWAKYDPEDDRRTRGNQAGIIEELIQNRDFTKRQAESIELVSCPIKR